jgi:hypothetical protein
MASSNDRDVDIPDNILRSSLQSLLDHNKQTFMDVSLQWYERYISQFPNSVLRNHKVLFVEMCSQLSCPFELDKCLADKWTGGSDKDGRPDLRGISVHRFLFNCFFGNLSKAKSAIASLLDPHTVVNRDRNIDNICGSLNCIQPTCHASFPSYWTPKSGFKFREVPDSEIIYARSRPWCRDFLSTDDIRMILGLCHPDSSVFSSKTCTKSRWTGATQGQPIFNVSGNQWIRLFQLLFDKEPYKLQSILSKEPRRYDDNQLYTSWFMLPKVGGCLSPACLHMLCYNRQTVRLSDRHISRVTETSLKRGRELGSIFTLAFANHAVNVEMRSSKGNCCMPFLFEHRD